MFASTAWAEDRLTELRDEHQSLFEQFIDKFKGGGVHIYTDYSGIGSGEESFRQICAAAEMLLGQKVEAKCIRAGDVDIACRGVLAELACDTSVALAPACVHGDILERCPPQLLAKMQAAQAKHIQQVEERPGADIQTEGVAFLHEVAEWIQESADCNRSTPLMAECSVHKKKCPVLPIYDEASTSTGSATQAPTLLGSIAGVCCQDWSHMGKRLQWLGPGALVLLEWCREKLMSQDDFLIIECVSAFDHQGLAHLLSPAFTMAVLDFSPTLVGLPVERHRKYMLCISRRLRWNLPDGCQNHQQFFTELFEKDVCR